MNTICTQGKRTLQFLSVYVHSSSSYIIVLYWDVYVHILILCVTASPQSASKWHRRSPLLHLVPTPVEPVM